MRNVTRLKQPTYTKRVKNADTIMYAIRAEMEWYAIKDMAEAVGVTASCIYAIASGKTKWPRPATFFGLVDFLDLELVLVKS